MQNKGAVKLLAFLLTLVCLYQLSFTLFTKLTESKAREIAKGDIVVEEQYLDSIAGIGIYNLGFKNFTYKDCKEREINLGLDLKGGMDVILEVSVADIVTSLSNYSKDTTFVKAMSLAKEKYQVSQSDFLTLFGEAFSQVDPNARLAAIFNTIELKDKITFNSSNDEVLKVLREQSNAAIDNSFKILSTRIDKFGVVSPTIQKMSKPGRLALQLPGVKDPKRVRKLLQGTASLEFWETYENNEIYPSLLEVNKRIKEIETASTVLTDSTKAEVKPTAVNAVKNKGSKKEVKADSSKTENALLAAMKKDTLQKKDSTSIMPEQFKKEYPLFSVLRPYSGNEGQLISGSVVGSSNVYDTAKVNTYLSLKQVKSLLPRDVKFVWELKPSTFDKSGKTFLLHAIKVTGRDGRAPLDGGVVVTARADFNQQRSSESEVSMSMNGEGTKVWARLTRDNVGRCIAIILDNAVVSAPRVNSEITGGSSQITGGFTVEEAKDLANVLECGKLPAPAHIIKENVVGPTLGKESIQKSMWSFIIAFAGVMLYMWLYYGRAGNVANIALFANVVFLFGTITSIGTFLTLPGVAGLVLTLAMAVDGNVIIYERMREEIRAGKGMRMVVKDGFWHAYSSIIDGHVTTILTGVVLFLFGSGPVQGFAITLIIGLLLSLFSSIFIARLMFEWMLDREMNISLGNKFTFNAFHNIKIDFIGLRKPMYVVASIIIVVGVISLLVRGLDKSVEFTGGRTYIVRFDHPVVTDNVRSSLATVFGDAPEVKTFGPDNQVKITTKYMIEDKSLKADSIVDVALYNGLLTYLPANFAYADFVSDSQSKTVGQLSSEKVDPVMSKDLVWQAFMAVFFGLVVIFIYIAIRFKNWKYGLGGVISLFHDTMIVITLFSLLHKILPFSLEVDQQFIAALLTIIGYSIMDTVIIFDRIREYNLLYPKRDLAMNINGAINSTLGRTINTSGITLVTLLVIFIFGGEMLRGFVFALISGVALGTFSSVFIATPVAYDLIMWGKKKEAKKTESIKE
jgi:SecD/SecF fusion protein